MSIGDSERSLLCFAAATSRLVTCLISSDLIAPHRISCHFISVDARSSLWFYHLISLHLRVSFVFSCYLSLCLATVFCINFWFFCFIRNQVISAHLLPEPIWSQLISCHLIFFEINLPSFHVPWHFACSPHASSSMSKHLISHLIFLHLSCNLFTIPTQQDTAAAFSTRTTRKGHLQSSCLHGPQRRMQSGG